MEVTIFLPGRALLGFQVVGLIRFRSGLIRVSGWALLGSGRALLGFQVGPYQGFRSGLIWGLGLIRSPKNQNFETPILGQF